MSIIDKTKTWILQIAIRKGLRSVIMALVARLLALAAMPVLGGFGVSVQIDPATLANALTGLILGGLEMARNYLKRRIPALEKYL